MPPLLLAMILNLHTPFQNTNGSEIAFNSNNRIGNNTFPSSDNKYKLMPLSLNQSAILSSITTDFLSTA